MLLLFVDAKEMVVLEFKTENRILLALAEFELNFIYIFRDLRLRGCKEWEDSWKGVSCVLI